MELAVKLARARIANDVFATGDNILTPAISIALGEDDRSSTCSFTLNDPGFVIGAKYRAISVEAGGILVPGNLLSAPSAPATGSSSSGQSPAASTLPTATTGEVPLAIVRECLRQGVSDPTKIAFILAVAEGESSFNYNAHNEETTNPNVPDKRYGGRGLVQITQRYNYEYFGQVLGVDLAGNPDLAFRPDIALYILVAGIKRGWCGRGGLDRWVTGPGSIANAYRAIQGGVWGSRYQRFFDRWLRDVPALIQQAGGSATPPAAPPVDPMSALPTTAPTPAPTAAPTQESSVKGTEIILELAVGSGLRFKDAIAFHFIHTGTESNWDASGTQTTTFTGKSVRWLLTRAPVTESFENLTFRQYLEARCRAFGLRLEMEGDGLRYQHLSQDGQTHLNLILREARRIGFSIREGTGDRAGTLIVAPAARPQFTNFIVDEEVLIKPSRFTDEARGSTPAQPLATASSPGMGAEQSPTTIDRASGAITPTNPAAPPSQAGTGNTPTSQSATPGTATPPVGGTPAPSGTPAGSAAPTAALASQQPTETKTEGPTQRRRADGAIVTTRRTITTKTEPNQITRTTETRTSIVPISGTATAQVRTEVIEITPEGRKITVTIQQGLGAPQTSPPTTEPLTADDRRLLALSTRPAAASGAPTAAAGAGLPNQPAGAIDLLDGRAEAAALSQEQQRVKGYESTHTLVMNMETLQLVPGQIVGLSKRLYPDAFATEQRIGSVAHDFAAGTTTITCYTPQAPPPGSSSGSATQLASPTTPAAPGGFIFPIPRGATTIGDGYGTRRGRAPGYRHTILDVTAPAGTPVVAMADGTIERVALNAGGAGHLMVIRHGGGYEAVYMHGQAGSPFIKESGPVKQGEPVFRVGTTGASSGNHLHLKFTLNGSYCLLSRVGLDVLNMGLPVRRFNEGCNQY